MRWLLLALLLVPRAAVAETVYSALDATSLDKMSGVLARHVAYLEILPKRAASPMSPEPRNGYAAAIEPDLLVALSHLVDDAEKIEVIGPRGRLLAEAVLVDRERRVALLRTSEPLAKIGLLPAPLAPIAERKRDMELFALVSTEGASGVMHAVITEEGDIPEYGGFPRIDLKLSAGMPVFDNRARLVGYSRVLAWDHDRYMIVPLEKVTAARTSTGASSAPAEKKPERPWWAR